LRLRDEQTGFHLQTTLQEKARKPCAPTKSVLRIRRNLPDHPVALAEPVDHGVAADADDVVVDENGSEVPGQGLVLNIMAIEFEEIGQFFARIVVVVKQLDHVLLGSPLGHRELL
jgi:hypothetical protein